MVRLVISRSVGNDEVPLERLNCDKKSEVVGIWVSPSGEK